MANMNKGPYPCFLTICQNEKKARVNSFYSILENREYRFSESIFLGDHTEVVASCDGWLVMLLLNNTYNYRRYFLLDLSTTQTINLPLLDYRSPITCSKLGYHRTAVFPLRNIVITAPPTSPHCVVALFPSLNRRLPHIIWRPGFKDWKLARGFKLEDAVKCRVLENPVVCDGRIFDERKHRFEVCRLCEDGLVFRELRSTPLPSLRAPPKSYDCFLVESCQKVHMVQILKSDVKVEWLPSVSVLELVKGSHSPKTPKFVRVTSIGDDRAFFVNRCRNMASFSCSVANSGFKGNAVYFTGEELDDWNLYVHGMKENLTWIYRQQPSPTTSSKRCPAVLLMVRP